MDITSEFKVYYNLDEETKPYLETKELKDDLGNGIKRGFVNNVLHLQSTTPQK